MSIQSYRQQRCFSSSVLVEGIWDDLAIFGYIYNTISFERGPWGERGRGRARTPLTLRTPFKGNLLIFGIIWNIFGIFWDILRSLWNIMEYY